METSSTDDALAVTCHQTCRHVRHSNTLRVFFWISVAAEKDFVGASLVSVLHKLLSDERSAPEIKYNSMILICAVMGSGETYYYCFNLFKKASFKQRNSEQQVWHHSVVVITYFSSHRNEKDWKPYND